MRAQMVGCRRYWNLLECLPCLKTLPSKSTRDRFLLQKGMQVVGRMNEVVGCLQSLQYTVDNVWSSPPPHR